MASIHFDDLLSVGALYGLLVGPLPDVSGKAKGYSFALFNRAKRRCVHWTQREISSFDLPNESWFEIYVTFYLGHVVLYLDRDCRLVDDILV